MRANVADELGLSRDVVVAAGGGDAAVGAVALGAVRPGDAFISLGTACQWVIASDVYRAAPEKLVHSFAHALPGRWYRMAAMLNGAGALAFAGRLLGAEVAALEAEAAADYRGPADLLFLPYLSGERTPHDDPHARGVAFGLTEASSRADFARAVMEGVAFTLADARDCLAATGDVADAGRAHRRRREEPAVGAHDRFGLRRRGDSLSRRRGRAGVRRGAARRGSPRPAKRRKTLCRPPETLDATAPEPALCATPSPARRERFQSLYRALRPEFAISGGAVSRRRRAARSKCCAGGRPPASISRSTKRRAIVSPKPRAPPRVARRRRRSRRAPAAPVAGAPRRRRTPPRARRRNGRPRRRRSTNCARR